MIRNSSSKYDLLDFTIVKFSKYSHQNVQIVKTAISNQTKLS
jgi:hypothetical protein